MTSRLKSAAWTLGALLSALVAVISYRYTLGRGPVPPNIAENTFLNPWIAIHATSAATALLLGPFQFLSKIRLTRPLLHRWSGRAYIAACILGGASALVLAKGISTGPIAAFGFATLGIVWMFVSLKGWKSALDRQWSVHRRWMIRSFALTFAAVTLRLYLPFAVFGYLVQIDFADAYRVIAWACWVPNLIVAELYIRSTRGRPLRANPTQPA